MTTPAALEQLLRQPPIIADAGFSQAVMARIASRQRRRQQALLAVWLISTVAALTVVFTHLPAWLALLDPLSGLWATSTEQVAQRVSDVALTPFWQSSGALVAVGLLAVLTAAAAAAAWDWARDYRPLN